MDITLKGNNGEKVVIPIEDLIQKYWSDENSKPNRIEIIVSHNKQELEVVASGMEAMGLSVETGYFDPDDESSVDVSKQLIGFHYVVLKKKV